MISKFAERTAQPADESDSFVNTESISLSAQSFRIELNELGLNSGGETLMKSSKEKKKVEESLRKESSPEMSIKNGSSDQEYSVFQPFRQPEEQDQPDIGNLIQIEDQKVVGQQVIPVPAGIAASSPSRTQIAGAN